jgi:hypothetical protein
MLVTPQKRGTHNYTEHQTELAPFVIMHSHGLMTHTRTTRNGIPVSKPVKHPKTVDGGGVPDFGLVSSGEGTTCPTQQSFRVRC